MNILKEGIESLTMFVVAIATVGFFSILALDSRIDDLEDSIEPVKSENTILLEEINDQFITKEYLKSSLDSVFSDQSNDIREIVKQELDK